MADPCDLIKQLANELEGCNCADQYPHISTLIAKARALLYSKSNPMVQND